MSQLILDQGSTWVRIWTWYNEDMTPVNLTGAYVAFQIRMGGPNAPLGVDLDNGAKGGITVTSLEGQILVKILPSQTSALNLTPIPHGQGEEVQADGSIRRAFGAICTWGLEVTMPDQPNPTVVPLDNGKIVITREVVRE